MSNKGDESLARVGGRAGIDIDGSVGPITDTSADEAIAAPGAGKRIGITAIMVTNADDTDGTLVSIRSASTVIWWGFAKVEAGWSINFTKPLMAAENEAITVICGTAVTNGVYASINGVVLPTNG